MIQRKDMDQLPLEVKALHLSVCRYRHACVLDPSKNRQNFPTLVVLA